MFNFHLVTGPILAGNATISKNTRQGERKTFDKYSATFLKGHLDYVVT